MVRNKYWLLQYFSWTCLWICWPYNLLGFKPVRYFGKLREISSICSVLIPDICRIVIDIDRVVGMLHFRFLMSLPTAHTDPKTYLSDGAKQCTCMQCVAHADRPVHHPHVKCINIPSGKVVQTLRSMLVGLHHSMWKLEAERKLSLLLLVLLDSQKTRCMFIPTQCLQQHQKYNLVCELYDNGFLNDTKTLLCCAQHQNHVGHLVCAFSRSVSS